jgi:putative flavoprotein involved in K+ transport
MSFDLHSLPWSDAPVVVVGAGQSGLAAARAMSKVNVPVVVLEAGDRASGSWPHYYDSLRLCSPAGYSSTPGRAFPGGPGSLPSP